MTEPVELAVLKITTRRGVKTYHAMYKGGVLISSTGRKSAKDYVHKFNANLKKTQAS